MNILIEKYWAGETTLQEESDIKQYLNSGNVAKSHMELIPLFAFFNAQSGLEMGKALDMAKISGSTSDLDLDTDSDILVEKYWAGQTSIVEEGELKRIAKMGGLRAEPDLEALLLGIAAEREVMMTKSLDLSFVKEPQVTAKYRKLMPKIMSIAASLAILLMVAFNFLSEDTSSYQNKYTEVQNPDEALEITMEALAFLSNKYDKGTQPMKYIKELERTDVFNLTN